MWTKKWCFSVYSAAQAVSKSQVTQEKNFLESSLYFVMYCNDEKSLICSKCKIYLKHNKKVKVIVFTKSFTEKETQLN